MNDENIVAIYQSKKTNYPEQKSKLKSKSKKDHFKVTENKKDHIYRCIESIFSLLKMDKDNSGSKKWNPLKNIIKIDDLVLIKPNLVGTQPKYMCKDCGPAECVAVHGSIIRPLVEYAYKAVGDGGRIIVAEAPMDITDFDEITKITGISQIIKYLQSVKNIPVELLDLRKRFVERWTWKEKKLKGDPNGYLKVDLGSNSEFHGVSGTFQAASAYGYDSQLPDKYHKKNHFYEIPKSVLMANCIINVSKMKTHNIAGVTLSLKNKVGITTQKKWLPHHTKGGVKDGGDEYIDEPEKLSKRDLWVHKTSKIPLGKQILHLGAHLLYSTKYKNGYKATSISDGEWYGNDTAWRMVLDLNKILFYSDLKGNLKNNKQRKYLTIIDGIIGGEGEGPIRCTPKKTGIIIGGYDPVAVDFETAKIMGFDPIKIPTINNSSKLKKHTLGDHKASCVSNVDIKNLNLKFKPPFGWEGHIEIK